MKIRESFVANSSSSSFIIAITDNLTKEELRANADYSKVTPFIEDYELERSEHAVVNEAIDDLFNIKEHNFMRLDNWKIISREGNTEDFADDFLSAMLHNEVFKNTENFRSK